jgi:serine/threonine protein kinase
MESLHINTPTTPPAAGSSAGGRYELGLTPARQSPLQQWPAVSSDRWMMAAQAFEILDELLGQGAFGSVFKARHIASGDFVAAKIVPNSKQDPAHARNEAVLMRRLRHVNLLGVLGPAQELGLEPGRPPSMVLYLELCETDMFARVRRSGALSEPETKHYLRQIMAAVQHMHSHGVCHRDLKLENILIDAHDVCKVTDFGLAVQYERYSSTNERWLHEICGSRSYVAPEVLEEGGYDGFSVRARARNRKCA